MRRIGAGIPAVAAQSGERCGNAALQMVMSLAVCLIVLLALLKLWSGSGGEDQGLRGEVQSRLQSVMSGQAAAENDNPGAGNAGGGGGGAGNPGNGQQPPEPPSTLTDAERREVEKLRNLARRLGGLANLAALAGDEIEATRLTALADAALLSAAAILGAEHLKTEIAAIAARRTVEATAEALLRAIENRVPITRFVRLPIIDGIGQLTGDFIHWWREQQPAPTTLGRVGEQTIGCCC